MLQVFYKWCAHRITPTPTLPEIMQREADELYRDTISRELDLIDAQHKIQANQAKAQYLLAKIAKPS